jgi:hypothetical protein
MSKKFAIAVLALAMSAGFAQAKMMKPMHHMHLGACADGQVSASCMCGSGKTHAVCKKGQWCHSYNGTCGS